jgi:hypothetical protein
MRGMFRRCAHGRQQLDRHGTTVQFVLSLIDAHLR